MKTHMEALNQARGKNPINFFLFFSGLSCAFQGHLFSFLTEVEVGSVIRFGCDVISSFNEGILIESSRGMMPPPQVSGLH